MNSRPKDPKTARNKNVLVIGGSGSGKTRFWLKPNLMQMHSSFPVSQRIQFQLIVGCNLAQLRNIKYGQTRTAGNQNRLGCFARDEKSRTFSSNSQTSYILLNLVAKQSLDFVLHRLSGVLVEVDTDNIGRAVYLLSDGGCGVLCGGLCCCVSVFCHSIPPMNEKCPTRKG